MGAGNPSIELCLYGTKDHGDIAGGLACCPLPRSEDGGGGDLVGGFGQVGEAVGQAGAGQDEGVGFDVFGLAEVCQQVQVFAEALQLVMGFFRQVIAGLAWRSLAHDGLLIFFAMECLARARARCREVRNREQPAGLFPLRVLY